MFVDNVFYKLSVTNIVFNLQQQTFHYWLCILVQRIFVINFSFI